MPTSSSFEFFNIQTSNQKNVYVIQELKKYQIGKMCVSGYLRTLGGGGSVRAHVSALGPIIGNELSFTFRNFMY